jgi:hypothetical protein
MPITLKFVLEWNVTIFQGEKKVTKAVQIDLVNNAGSDINSTQITTGHVIIMAKLDGSACLCFDVISQRII